MKNIGTVIILLLIFCSYYGKGWEIRWNHISRRAKYSLLGIAIAANDFGISSSNSNHENVFFPTIGVVHADSTGKFSTKLTARKRYLPRIQEDYKILQKFDSTNNEDVSNFIVEELPKLERAMNLYGYSLRKGENPDEISRKAEMLTKEFVRTMQILQKSNYEASKLEDCRKVFGEYINFAKIET